MNGRMNRRGFFRLVAGAALAPVVAKVGQAFPLPPILWGDGVHDDTAALQALIDGEIVEFADRTIADGCGWIEDVLHLPKAIYRTSEALQLRNPSDQIYDFGGSRLIASPDFSSSEMVVIPAHGSATLSNVVLVGGGDGIRFNFSDFTTSTMRSSQ